MDEKAPKNEIVSPKDIEALVSDLVQYDKQHSQGGWLGKMMSASFFKYERDDEESAQVAKPAKNPALDNLNHEIKMNLTLEDLQGIHASTLEKLGLSLESPNKDGDIDEKEIYAVGEIQIHISNKNKFLLFMVSLTEGTLAELQKSLLKTVGKKLINQMKDEYNLNQSDERMLELFTGIKELGSEYERLEMPEIASSLRMYMKYAKMHCLKEFILALNNHLFEPIGEGFNLSTFQRDITPERYTKDWDEKAFATLDAIKKNSKAGELYKEAVAYLKDCLAFAETDERLIHRQDENGIGLMESIRKTKEKLSHYG